MKTVNLSWCSVYRTPEGKVEIWAGGREEFTPDEARQLADALKEVADAYVDPVETKARELAGIWNKHAGSQISWERSFEPWQDKMRALARHVLEGEEEIRRGALTVHVGPCIHCGRNTLQGEDADSVCLSCLDANEGVEEARKNFEDPRNAPICQQRFYQDDCRSACDRALNHNGQHVAIYTGGSVYARWPNKDFRETLKRIPDELVAAQAEIRRLSAELLTVVGQCSEEHHWKGNCPADPWRKCFRDECLRSTQAAASELASMTRRAEAAEEEAHKWWQRAKSVQGIPYMQTVKERDSARRWAQEWKRAAKHNRDLYTWYRAKELTADKHKHEWQDGEEGRWCLCGAREVSLVMPVNEDADRMIAQMISKLPPAESRKLTANEAATLRARADGAEAASQRWADQSVTDRGEFYRELYALRTALTQAVEALEAVADGGFDVPDHHEDDCPGDCEDHATAWLINRAHVSARKLLNPEGGE